MSPGGGGHRSAAPITAGTNQRRPRPAIAAEQSDPALTPWAGCRTGPEEIRQSLTAFFARFTVADRLITTVT
ncbi:hypothetical protein [Streptomyces sp. 2A115]|uniref:hypothetical protein n=1 Tax=Streptomyces sp. 2A115 TaxID=3457439 RepID=UPI003FD0133D